jgi:hypothetical protein
MMFRIVWPRSRGAFRQHGYAFVFVDEFSTYQEAIADVVRKRTDTYKWAKIVWVSSPDATARRPSDADPIFAEFAQTDQRRWHLDEPHGGEPFFLVFGSPDSPACIKWDGKARRADGSWDLDVVRETAHYRTPAGATITEADRWPLIQAIARSWVVFHPPIGALRLNVV